MQPLSKTSASSIKTGFTLIELIIVTGLSALLLLTVSSLFMTFLLSNSRTNTRQLVTTEGKFALNQMQFMLRNATGLVQNSNGDICATNMDRIAFESIDGGATEFRLELDGADQKIASVSGTATQYITSDGVTITNGPTFDCSQSGNATTVEVQFSLSKDTPNGTIEDQFNSRINLRN